MQLSANSAWFTVTLNGRTDFQVYSFSGQEAVSQPYVFSLELVHPRHDEPLTAFIGAPVLLTIFDRSGTPRLVHGLVHEMSRLHRGNHLTHYQCRIVPRFWFLDKNREHRIFQNKSVQQIITQVLQEQGFASETFAFKCFNTYPPREYCVQYGESDLHFISRLCEEEGIYYYFEHSIDGHCLCFSDMPGGAPIPGLSVLRYAPGSGQVADTSVVSRVSLHAQALSDKAMYRDWSFLTPTVMLEASADEPDFAKAPAAPGIDYTTYRSPHLYQSIAEGERYARLQLLRQLTRQTWIEAQSDASRFMPGFTFSLHGHNNPQMNATWWITSVVHNGVQPQVLGREAPDSGMSYVAHLECIPESTQFVPELMHPKCRIIGDQTALITGPAGEEIYTDEYGRVKVQFFWDREGKQDENTTCWIRVSQGWAGTQYGTMALPRIGHEVIVSFLEGDPDRPLITGRVYHADNMPPYNLPLNKTRTVFKSMSTPGGEGGRGFNELRIEDKTGQEEIYIHAEKDVNVHVKNDWKVDIARDQRCTTDNNTYVRTEGETHETLRKQRKTELFATDNQTLHADSHTKVDDKWLTKVNAEVHLYAGEKAVFAAGTEATLKGGGSWIKFDPAGVFMGGSAISLGGGGSAGERKAAEPELPEMSCGVKTENKPKYQGLMPHAASVTSTSQSGGDTSSRSSETPVSEEVFKEEQEKDFEVEFLHACDDATFKKSKNLILAVPEGTLIYDSQPDIILTKQATHYINLTPENKWRNEDITHVDRTTQKPRIVVRFKKKQVERIKVEIYMLKGNDPLSYTDEEKKRNVNFTEKLSGEYDTDSNGMVIITDLAINAIGGNIYKVQATSVSTGTTKQSRGTIVTWRYLWVQKIICGDGQWIPPANAFDTMSEMVEEYKKSFIFINHTQLPTQKVREYEFLDFYDKKSVDFFKEYLKTLPDVQKVAPFVTTAALNRTMGIVIEKTIKKETNVGPSEKPLVMHVPDFFIAAYKNFDASSGTYKNSKWLISATCDGEDISNLVTCHGMDNAGVGSTSPPYFIGTYMEIDISKLPAKADLSFIVLRFNAVTPLAGRNWDTICNTVGEVLFLEKGELEKQIKDVVDYTPMIPIVMGHEIGHWVGMVSDGKKRGLPASHSNHYTEFTTKYEELKRHVGNHCMDGYISPDGAGTCLMFGAASVQFFCKDCHVMLRKIDCNLGSKI